MTSEKDFQEMEAMRLWNAVPMGYVFSYFVFRTIEIGVCRLCLDSYEYNQHWKGARKKTRKKTGTIITSKVKMPKHKMVCCECEKKLRRIKNQIVLHQGRKEDIPYWKKKYMPLIEMKVIQLNIEQYDKGN